MKDNSQTYPEIEALRSYFDKAEMNFRKHEKVIRDDLFFVDCSMNDQLYQLLIDDEYQDFSVDHPLACLYLVLTALETYVECDDYLVFCNHHDIRPAEQKWLNYYTSLDFIYKQFEKQFGAIDSCISAYDYQLRTGVVQALKDG
jgi:hypothetical protein